ncbi:transcriptional activator FOSB/c-Fos and related bZIP transcription factor [Cryphonectria parasitica EP155]|uniref:Transcriptional activator FOSB/c-Fos and related bZIP transcription factor n=1 Tax=Cryphonectria parasitica (strain ATCC 38755 / EP155) TaxID=660469 RepID=A0A9P4Y9F1_CRYP1|nr:transcriptional activator FOSB/c-Fos and related bZIP transcription factor [Cryphonectria parasitica EP155]KAF3769402.1 transcriptional activator FOSB/c-Fos and related bZIP transcription factor [Cryphonectria parasitica EP155]
MMDHRSNLMTPSPQVKSEDYLGEDDMMPLFDDGADDHASVDPSNLLSTPGEHFRAMSPSDAGTPAPEGTPETSDKKPTKKRKSWGQVLPEPKTNLPPRKRAKTEDEKEQRRVERVLRNRRAAQSSRERKRLETEALATRNKQLEDALLALTQQYQVLEKELKKVKPELGGISTSSDSHVTLSQPLFSYPAPAPKVAEVEQPAQQDISTMSQPTLDLINSLVRQAQQEADGNTPKTVNPATISPALAPIAEEPESEQPDAVTPLDSAVPLPPPSQAANVTEAVVADSTTLSTAGGNDDDTFFDGGLGAAEPGSAFFDNLLHIPDFGDIPSPEASSIDFDYQAGDQPSDLDFTTTWDEYMSNPADNDDSYGFLQAPASPAPAEASNQQPTAGASSSGCDARGIAVEAK